MQRETQPHSYWEDSGQNLRQGEQRNDAGGPAAASPCQYLLPLLVTLLLCCIHAGGLAGLYCCCTANGFPCFCGNTRGGSEEKERKRGKSMQVPLERILVVASQELKGCKVLIMTRELVNAKLGSTLSTTLPRSPTPLTLPPQWPSNCPHRLRGIGNPDNSSMLPKPCHRFAHNSHKYYP